MIGPQLKLGTDPIHSELYLQLLRLNNNDLAAIRICKHAGARKKTPGEKDDSGE